MVTYAPPPTRAKLAETATGARVKHSGMIWVRLVFDGFTGLLELPVWPNCGSGRHSHLAASSGSGIQLGALTVLVVSLNPSMTRLLRSVCVASPFPINSSLTEMT